MIISVHLPKTAGSSFKASLDQHFGQKLMLDYADFPINIPILQRNRNVLISSLNNAERNFDEIECIHGHFMPMKYLLLNSKQPLTFVIWMRHPVERIISHYYFWQRYYQPEAPPLHKRIVEEKWTLEKFCLSDEMRDLYHQFLWGFPLHNFDFIGITEHYEDDFRYFANKYLHKKVASFKENINENRNENYTLNSSFRKQIESFHEIDMELYHSALKLRFQRNQPILSKVFSYLPNL
ncbi:MAG: hypothetical protein ACOYN5_02260 [Bacteroidales bacterium]